MVSKFDRIVWQVISEADLVIEVLDARIPLESRCRRIERIVERKGKPLVLVINKSNLVPRPVMEEWRKIFSREYPTIYISARDRLGTRRLWQVIKKNAPKLPVKVAVVGYPNVGKSSIINILKGRHSLGTSPIPGFTKHKQLVKASQMIYVIDTPGVFPSPKKEPEIAVISALRPESLDDPVIPALKLLEIALKKSPLSIEETYKIKVDTKDPYTILAKIAERRGLLLKDGKLNIDEAARILIRDWQSGRLIFYFTPSDYGLSPSTEEEISEKSN